jgi:hypothetical protein
LFQALGASFLVLPLMAHADSAHLLTRQVAGPLVISVFTTPDVLAVGPAEVSVLVEQVFPAQVLLDADVSLDLTCRAHCAPSLHARLAHPGGTNQLLQVAEVSLPGPGIWDAVIAVREQGREARVGAQLVVAPHSSRRGSIWLFALLPLCVGAMFFWVEQARRRRAANST